MSQVQMYIKTETLFYIQSIPGSKTQNLDWRPQIRKAPTGLSLSGSVFRDYELIVVFVQRLETLRIEAELASIQGSCI